MPSYKYNCLQNLEINWLPWSEIIISGVLYRENIRDIKAFVRLVAEVSVTGIKCLIFVSL